MHVGGKAGGRGVARPGGVGVKDVAQGGAPWMVGMEKDGAGAGARDEDLVAKTWYNRCDRSVWAQPKAGQSLLE